MKSTAVLLSLLLSLAAVGCAAPTDDADAESSGSAISGDPKYDAVVHGKTRVDTDATRNASQSASTHMIGFIKGAKTDKVLDRLLSVKGWTEIRDADGEQPFVKAEVTSDTTVAGARKINVKLTLDKGVTLEVEGTAKQGDRGIEVRMVNTTGYKHWLAGTILEAGKMHISFDLVPYDSGVIVDATMTAKLKKMEDKAAGMTASVALVFDWIAAGAR
ncbi:MAG TPA: hypothetical protein VLT33_29940 [Labilithrix sp.]|nr:hypothetical protein [Labilithrix sp.]